MAFDISSVLGDLGKPAKKPDGEQIEQIELHLIDPNPKNYYSMDGIESLADNIRMFGLMDPLRVKRMDGGHYMVISGHRRREALRKLAEDGTFPDGFHHAVNCIVEGVNDLAGGIEDPEKAAKAAELAEELKLIFANSDTRVLSSSDQALQVRKIRDLLTGLKELGYPLPGKLREHVAAAAGISESRVARLDVIEKGLTEPALRKAWKDAKLQETSAYEIARRSPEVQRRLVTCVPFTALCEAKTATVVAFLDTAETAENRKRSGEAPDEAPEETPEPEVSTPDTAEPEAPEFDGHGHLKWDGADEYLKRREEEDFEFSDRLEDMADRFIRELPFLDSRQQGIEILKKKFKNSGFTGKCGNHFECSAKGLTIRNQKIEGFRYIPDGPFEVTRTWTDVYDMLCMIALTDWTCDDGSDDKHSKPSTKAVTAPEWLTGEPEAEGRYWCRVLIGGDLKPHEQRMEWKAGGWHVFGDRAEKYLMQILGWWPLPPEV